MIENKYFTITVEDVKGYIDETGRAWLNLENVARGLGFTTVATSGNKVIRWNRVKKYLNEFNFILDNEDAKETTFIPEEIFYLLAMKAKNEVAINFQKKIAYEILPEIRKNGYYCLTGKTPDSYMLDDRVERAKRWIEETEEWQARLREKDDKIEEDEPYTNYGKVVSASTGSITIQNFGSILSTDIPKFYLIDENNNYIIRKTGANTVYEYLVQNNYIYPLKYKSRKYLPYTKYLKQGLFEIVEYSNEDSELCFLVTYITTKGQQIITNKIKENYEQLFNNKLETVSEII